MMPADPTIASLGLEPTHSAREAAVRSSPHSRPDDCRQRRHVGDLSQRHIPGFVR
jgi:hypothetical protein